MSWGHRLVVALIAAAVGSGARSVVAAEGAVAGERAATLKLRAGERGRSKTPVIVPIPDKLQDVTQFRLERVADGKTVPVQVLPGEPRSVAWILEEDLPAKGVRRYRLSAAASAASDEGVSCTDDGAQLRVAVGGRPVLIYQEAIAESPPGIAPLFRRSGQIHPLKTPKGLVVTDDFPPDHAHQHAVFFAWVNSTFEGRHIDFWNQSGKTGRVEHVKTLGTITGPVFGQFRVQLRHDDITTPKAPKPVLDETWTIRVYRVDDAHVIDFESVQTCAGTEPLTLNQYHYGGMGLRGNRQWLDPEVKGSEPPDPARNGRSDFLTSDGKGRRTGNHSRPTWVDLSGEADGQTGGVAILDHPTNFRFPQPVRLHPNKPYFCFAPMVLGSFEIIPGKPYVSHYRLIVHDGPPDARTIDGYWSDYAEPPQVQVVANGE